MVFILLLINKSRMPLNFFTSPYYDDYSETSHFYRVLFKPSKAVQARELTQLQTILQQQITYFGNSIYKNGSMVTPGAIATDPKTNYVKLNATYGTLNNVPIPINLDLFTGQVIIGGTTGLLAQVVYLVPAENNDPPTLFVKYLNSGTNNEKQFLANETLSIKGTTVVLAQTISLAPCGLCISAQIGQGVYYIFGFFVRVEQQYLILNKYSSVTSCRVGLEVQESVVTAQDDSSLLDNSNGSSNYAAPGADRYKIELTLTRKEITNDVDDSNFIELVRLVNSVTQNIVTTDTYSIIEKELATRMADTNGDFAIRNFAADVREHLDTSFVTSGQASGGQAATNTSNATITLAQNASVVDNFYVGNSLYITDGSGAGQTFTIISYIATNKVATLDVDYVSGQVADGTSSYEITDLTKVNRGINPPSPFGDGDASKLAFGLESGRAYVDGYLIDTLVTQYVDVDKARDSLQVTGGVVSNPLGNYLLVKNVKNIPMPAASANRDYLAISICNKKANGSFTQATDEIGTCRVLNYEFFQGIGQSTADAIFKLYIFDLNMNAGQNINNARSFFLTNNGSNNLGNSLNSYGDICAEMLVANVNGKGLVNGNTLTGPASVGTELIVSYDPIANIVITEPNAGNTSQILATGGITTTGTTASLVNRTQIFDTSDDILIYPLTQKMVKSVTAADTAAHVNYYVRQTFEATRNGSGQYIFSTTPLTPFAPFNTTDYVACVVSSTDSNEIGKFINLASYINGGSFSGSPANTTLTFTINSGLGANVGTVVKLLATITKTNNNQKIKILTSTQLAYSTPTSVMSLAKADIYTIDKILDSGDPGIAADLNNPAHLDIKNRYLLNNGQRDYYYGIGRIALAPGSPPPLGQILIIFKYFAHGGSGDYFSVDSYENQLDYSLIPTYRGTNGIYYPLRDCLDFRSRKADDTSNFSANGSNYSHPIKPNFVTQADFSYYLSRTDKIYLDHYGKFNVIKGTSALVPTPPQDPLTGMMLFTVTLNPYTLSTTDLSLIATKNKRYTMQDISKLEDRISNLEYYVNLNQLEQKTQNTSITDPLTGLDRFKNGFIVDTFVGHNVGNVFDGDYKCSVDPIEGSLRPPFVQDSNTLILNREHSSGIVVREGVVFLNYTHIVYVQQLFATDTENVNPFAVFSWHGNLSLDPPTDSWKSTTQRPSIQVTDNSALDGIKYLNQWSEITWGDWQTGWTGQPQTTTTSSISTSQGTRVSTLNVPTPTGSVQAYSLSDNLVYIPIGQNSYLDSTLTGDKQTTLNLTTNTTVNTTQQIGQVRTGTQTETVVVSTEIINNKVIDTSVIPYIRSRRIKIVGTHFKPNTRFYPFFDNIDVSAYCRPYSDNTITPTLSQTTYVTENITWGGDFSPQDNINEGASTIGDNGKSASEVVGPLNAPIYSDGQGTVTLFFEIPCDNTLEFKTGTRTFRLTDSSTNDQSSDSYGDFDYIASGILETDQQTITSILQPQTITKSVTDSHVITNTTTNNSVTNNTVTVWVDPLAESFLVKEPGGMFVSKIDIYFAQADATVPITLQIRNMVNGYPGQYVVPFSEKTLYPNNKTLSSLSNSGQILPNFQAVTDKVINVTKDASVETTFEFDCPIYLNDATEYALVLMSNSNQYLVYTAVLGGTVIGSTNIVSKTPYTGAFFKSQNASTWVADPTTNLKFSIYRAKFDPTQTGLVALTNSSSSSTEKRPSSVNSKWFKYR